MSGKKVKKKKKAKKKKVVVRPPTPGPQGSEIGPEKQDITPPPTAADNATFEGLLDGKLAGETSDAKPKRPVGRPRKDTEPEAPQISEALIANAIRVPFELWAISNDVDQLKLKEVESKQLAEPIRVLIEYYLPRVPEIAFAWASLSVTTFWVMKPRLVIIAEIKKLKAAESPQGQGEQPAGKPAGGSDRFPTEKETARQEL